MSRPANVVLPGEEKVARLPQVILVVRPYLTTEIHDRRAASERADRVVHPFAKVSFRHDDLTRRGVPTSTIARRSIKVVASDCCGSTECRNHVTVRERRQLRLSLALLHVEPVRELALSLPPSRDGERGIVVEGCSK